MNVVIKQRLKRWIPPALASSVGGWQASRTPLFPASAIVGGAKLAGGLRFHLRPTQADRDIFRQIFIDDEYCMDGFPQATRLDRLYASLGRPLIVDAGANIGAAAVWLSLRYPSAIIIAIEPDPGNHRQLLRNTKSVPNIVPVLAALASRAGQLYLVDVGQGAWGYRTTETAAPDSIQVPAITLDDVLAMAPDSTPFLMKIDIEGAEADVFETPSAAFQRFPALAIELHDWMLPGKASSRNFLRWHVASRRDLVFRGENAFSFAVLNA